MGPGETNGSNTAGKRVLLVQLADLGDLLLAAPAIAYLRKSRPTSALTLLTKPTNLVLAESLVDEVIVADKHLYDHPIGLLSPWAAFHLLGLVRGLRRRHFKEVIFFHHLITPWGILKFRALAYACGASARAGLDDGRGRFLTISTRDLGFGAFTEAEYWNMLAGGGAEFRHPSDDDAAVRLLEQNGVSGAFAVVHPGSGTFSTARRWPIEKFGELADLLHVDLGVTVLITGTASEAALGRSISGTRSSFVVDLCGRTTLATVAALLRRAAVFVGNDGGMAQLAGSLGTPSVVVFGPTSPRTWTPIGKQVETVHRDLACSPCLYRFHEVGLRDGCPTRECLIDIPAATVARRAEVVARASQGALTA